MNAQYLIPLIWCALAAPLPQQVENKNDQPAGRPVRPFVSWMGPGSAVESAQVVRANTEADWHALWARHMGEKVTKNRFEQVDAPKIDFEQCCVVMVLRGKTFNSDGTRYIAGGETDAQILLRIDEQSYQTASFNGSGGAVDCTPFGIFVLPRTTKPIVVEDNVQGLIGKPPIWKEIARLAPPPAKN